MHTHTYTYVLLCVWYIYIYIYETGARSNTDLRLLQVAERLEVELEAGDRPVLLSGTPNHFKVTSKSPLVHLKVTFFRIPVFGSRQHRLLVHWA